MPKAGRAAEADTQEHPGRVHFASLEQKGLSSCAERVPPHRLAVLLERVTCRDCLSAVSRLLAGERNVRMAPHRKS